MKDILRRIEACNGEMRLMAARYESGWYCVCTLNDFPTTVKVWGQWERLVAGDFDYSEAKRFLARGAHQDIFKFSFARAGTPFAALENALEALEILCSQ